MFGHFQVLGFDEGDAVPFAIVIYVLEFFEYFGAGTAVVDVCRRNGVNRNVRMTSGRIKTKVETVWV